MTVFVDSEYRERCRPYHERQQGRTLSNDELDACIDATWQAAFDSPEVRATWRRLPRADDPTPAPPSRGEGGGGGTG